MSPSSSPHPTAVVHIPHASTIVPADVRASILIDAEELRHELLVMTDWFTDDLFAAGAEFATTVAFPVSRLVVDPERFTDDAEEPMAARGMGVIYERASTGAPLRRPPTPPERSALLERYYVPHHTALANAVESSVQANGRCLLIDGHSFSSAPLQHEPDQSASRPDVCIGADAFHTPEGLVARAASLVRDAGWSVEINRPFSGTMVPLAYYQRDARVASLMIEVNRRLYMDEQTAVRHAAFTDVQKALSLVIRSLIAST